VVAPPVALVPLLPLLVVPLPLVGWVAMAMLGRRLLLVVWTHCCCGSEAQG
jgi:hypothetical protein